MAVYMGDEKPLLKHQLSGARFIGPRSRSLLLDKPGLAKTRTSITALDMRHKKYLDKGGCLRGIVEAPAIGRTNWCDEFQMWSRVPRRLLVADDVHDLISWERGRFDVLIASYEFLTKWAHRFDAEMSFFDFYIADEAHRLKAESSQRKLAAIGEDGQGGISAWANWGCMLSGTIMPNDPIDIYNPLQWTGLIRSDRESFTKRYFTSQRRKAGSLQKPKKEMVPELKEMIERVAIRRTLEDAGIKLPPLMFSNRIIDGDRRELLAFLREQPNLSEQIYKAIDGGNVALLDSPHVATVRRLIGEAKALPYADLLLDELHDGKDKVAVFGFHRTALEMIRDRLKAHGISTVMLWGGMSRKQADESIYAFEKAGTARVLLANYETAGELLTFVSCRYLDNFERPWGPGKGEQVVNRVYRIGQTRTVFCRNITLRGSYDEDVNRTVQVKNESISLLGHGMLCETGEEELAL